MANKQFRWHGQVFNHGDSVTFYLYPSPPRKPRFISDAKLWIRDGALWACQNISGQKIDPSSAFGYRLGIRIHPHSKLDDPDFKIQKLSRACSKPRDEN